MTVPPMYRDAVGAIQFSYDSKLLGVGTIKGQVIVLVAEDGSRVASFPAFAGSSAPRGVAALSFSSDRKFMAVGGGLDISSSYVADTVRVFDVHSGALVAGCQNDNARIWKLAWVTGGRIAFVDGDFLQIWNPNEPAAPGPRFRVDSMSLAATADGRRLAVGNGSTVDVYTFD